MNPTEFKNYSSFCKFQLEAIESALKEAGVNYRIEPFEMPGSYQEELNECRSLDCFNLHLNLNDLPDHLDLRAIELEVVRKYREQFNLEYTNLFQIQELVQYGEL